MLSSQLQGSEEQMMVVRSPADYNVAMLSGSSKAA